MYYVLRQNLTTKSDTSTMEVGAKQKCISYFDGYKDAAIRYGGFKPTFLLTAQLPYNVDVTYAHVRMINETEPVKSFDMWIQYYNHNQPRTK